MSRLDEDLFTEKGQIQLFLSPLHNVIAGAVRTQNPTTMKDAKRYALASAPMTRFNIWKPVGREEQYGNSGSYRTSKGFGSGGSDRPLAVEVECFYCHKTGHTSFHCLKRKNEI